MKVKDAIGRELMQGGFGGVFIDEEDGRIVLSGSVESQEHKDQVGFLALANAYGLDVLNQIEVTLDKFRPTPPPISKSDISTLLIELGKVEGKIDDLAAAMNRIDDKLDVIKSLVRGQSQKIDIAAVDALGVSVKALRAKVKSISTIPPSENL